MGTLNDIHKAINAKMRKKYSNSVSFADFTTAFNIASLTLYNQLYVKQETGIQQDMLAPFKKCPVDGFKVENGKVKYPEDYGHLLEVYHDHKGEVVSSYTTSTHQVSLRLNSPIRRPNLDRGVAFHEKLDDGIGIYPKDAESVMLIYYCCPEKAVFLATYESTSDGDYQTVATGTTEVLWSKTAIPLLLAAIMEELAPAHEPVNYQGTATNKRLELLRDDER